ncbi:MAG TPA: hypothetical protein VJ933_06430 [Phaeodactylibacter sp.]|jgi:hypothetical protein|nr:hypothetical protein [Phaeodactylibacter sp.]
MVDNRSIKVKVLKETSKTVTIRMTTLNRKMPVPRKEFEKRVEDGLYEVIGGYDTEEEDK